MPPVACVEAVLVGAGNRGRYVYGAYARRHPERLRIVAVAEPVAERRLALAHEHDLPRERAFADWRELLAAPPAAAATIVATGDMDHTGPALAALAAGHHVLLEKPMAPDADECRALVRAAEGAGKILQVAHVLRYTAFYRAVAEALGAGRIGRPLTFDLREHIAHWHMTHSYVRGKFRKREIAAPILLAKSCHDLDLLAWLVGAPAERVASFGSLDHYRAEQAPAGAPERCTDGCPVQDTCPHDAVRFYAGPDEKLARGWPWTDVSADPSREARRAALATGPYGRCVYRCDNDVPDHQGVLVEFAGGVLGTFALQGHATHETRTLRVSGSEGELRGVLRGGRLELTRHGSLETEEIPIGPGRPADGHYGGDAGLLDHFTDVVAREAADEVVTSGRVSLASHLIGFAAERARLEGRVVGIED